MFGANIAKHVQSVISLNKLINVVFSQQCPLVNCSWFSKFVNTHSCHKKITQMYACSSQIFECPKSTRHKLFSFNMYVDFTKVMDQLEGALHSLLWNLLRVYEIWILINFPCYYGFWGCKEWKFVMFLDMNVISKKLYSNWQLIAKWRKVPENSRSGLS